MPKDSFIMKIMVSVKIMTKKVSYLQEYLIQDFYDFSKIPIDCNLMAGQVTWQINLGEYSQGHMAQEKNYQTIPYMLRKVYIMKNMVFTKKMTKKVSHLQVDLMQDTGNFSKITIDGNRWACQVTWKLHLMDQFHGHLAQEKNYQSLPYMVKVAYIMKNMMKIKIMTKKVNNLPWCMMLEACQFLKKILAQDYLA